jgi:type VI secretion system protein ImpH
MATQGGRTNPSLAEALFAEGYRFDFFEAVRILERLYPEREAVGQNANPSREVVRFGAHLSIEFPPSAVHEIARPADDNAPTHMTVSFMGLTGPLGVLPRRYTELLLERVRQKDYGLRDFLDLFNHRLISLFYRGWEKYRFRLGYERAAFQREADARFSRYVFGLFGMGTQGLRGRLEVDDAALLFYAGHLAQHCRSASALEGVLADYFGLPIKIVQFVGQWLPLSMANRSRLGPGGANNALAGSAVVGRRVWDQQAKFTVRIGPLTFADFAEFLPAGRSFRPLAQLTRFFVGQQFDFEVQLVLQAADVPRCRLGAQGADAPRLGWSTWLKTTEFTHDAGDAVFSGDATRIGALPD